MLLTVAPLAMLLTNAPSRASREEEAPYKTVAMSTPWMHMQHMGAQPRAHLLAHRQPVARADRVAVHKQQLVQAAQPHKLQQDVLVAAVIRRPPAPPEHTHTQKCCLSNVRSPPHPPGCVTHMRPAARLCLLSSHTSCDSRAHTSVL